MPLVPHREQLEQAFPRYFMPLTLLHSSLF
jgi:hypothetical protein